MEASPTLHDPLSGVVVVLLADFLRQHQGWGWLRLVAGATPYKDVPGLTMVKVMGQAQRHAPRPDLQFQSSRFGASVFGQFCSTGLPQPRSRVLDGRAVGAVGQRPLGQASLADQQPRSFGLAYRQTRGWACTFGGADTGQHCAHQGHGFLALCTCGTGRSVTSPWLPFGHGIGRSALGTSMHLQFVARHRQHASVRPARCAPSGQCRCLQTSVFLGIAFCSHAGFANGRRLDGPQL